MALMPKPAPTDACASSGIKCQTFIRILRIFDGILNDRGTRDKDYRAIRKIYTNTDLAGTAGRRQRSAANIGKIVAIRLLAILTTPTASDSSTLSRSFFTQEVYYKVGKNTRTLPGTHNSLLQSISNVFWPKHEKFSTPVNQVSRINL